MFSDSSQLAALKSFVTDQPARRVPSGATLKSAARVVEDSTAAVVSRDRAVWEVATDGSRYSTGLLQEVAAQDRVVEMRKSAAWALMRRGTSDALRASLKGETDANLIAWKEHLLAELNDNSLPVDIRPVRLIPEAPFDFTMPLEVEGTIEFRDEAGNWHSFVTGPISNRRLIGELTPAINADTFDSTLVLQKKIKDIHGSGKDHVEGYFLKGVSRRLEPNVFRHQYEGFSKHKVFRSGIVGDESKGVIEGAVASIVREADTQLTARENVGFPFPHSVRGTFRGFVFVNPAIANEPGRQLDGNLQIISPTDEKAGELVNGVFQGSFRGIPLDLDGDGVVELNAIDMNVTKDGVVAANSWGAGASAKSHGELKTLREQIERLNAQLERLERGAK